MEFLHARMTNAIKIKALVKVKKEMCIIHFVFHSVLIIHNSTSYTAAISLCQVNS